MYSCRMLECVYGHTSIGMAQYFKNVAAYDLPKSELMISIYMLLNQCLKVLSSEN
jgi:hypothetical protein